MMINEIVFFLAILATLSGVTFSSILMVVFLFALWFAGRRDYYQTQADLRSLNQLCRWIDRDVSNLAGQLKSMVSALEQSDDDCIKSAAQNIQIDVRGGDSFNSQSRDGSITQAQNIN